MRTSSPLAARAPRALSPADSDLSFLPRILVALLVLLSAGLGFGLLVAGVLGAVVMPLLTGA
ncbi:hypothetical protein LG293_17780 (plasmid) [Citricoccus nitrophenolicus]